MSQDKDELARRLAAMSEGASAPHEEAQHAPEHPHDHIDLSQQPPPAPTPPPPNAPRMIFPDTGRAQPPRTAPQPNPFARPNPPPPSIPAAAPSSSRPTAPGNVYYTPPTPLRSTPAQPTLPSGSTDIDDDAVIVPPPDPTVFAPRPAPRAPARLHRVQTLEFKRTIIPILLTLGVICPTLALVGFLAPATSPLSVLRSAWFSIPFILIGLLNLALAVITMLQVRDELQRQRRQELR
jgi:hypothetical protein